MDIATPHPPLPTSAPPQRIAIEEVRGLEELERLRPEWSELCERCPWATPFQRPEWLIPWARHFGGEASQAIALRTDGRLSALLPLVIFRDRSQRIVSLLGGGVSDYLDVLIDPQLAPDGAQRLIDRLLTRGDVWNALSLETLCTASPLLRVSVPAGWREDVIPQMPTLVLPINEHEQRRTRRLKASLRQAHRRAEREGGIEFEPVTGKQVDAALEALFLLHQKRWKRKGQPGLFGSEAVRDFHHEVAKGLDAMGKLRLYTLRIGPTLAAVYYGFLDQRRAYAYATGFEPDLSRFSPGLLLVEHAIEAARQEGALEFDFLRGQEPHKLLWGASERLVCRRELRPAVF